MLTASELPVMVYNNPHSTGTDLLPDHLAALQHTGRLWSVKETSGEATRIRELRDRLGEDTEIFVGADGIALEGFAQGASGWVAASAWLLPDHCQRLWSWPTAVIGPAPSTYGEASGMPSDSSRATPPSSHSSNRRSAIPDENRDPCAHPCRPPVPPHWRRCSTRSPNWRGNTQHEHYDFN